MMRRWIAGTLAALMIGAVTAVPLTLTAGADDISVDICADTPSPSAKKDPPVILPVIEVEEHLADELEMDMLAQTGWGEYRGLNGNQRVAVMQCVFNRLEDPRFSNTLREVISAPGQFVGYSKRNPIEEEFHDLAVETWNIWNMKNDGYEIDWLVPERFVYFHAEYIDGEWINVYTTQWNGGERLIIK